MQNAVCEMHLATTTDCQPPPEPSMLSFEFSCMNVHLGFINMEVMN